MGGHRALFGLVILGMFLGFRRLSFRRNCHSLPALRRPMGLASDGRRKVRAVAAIVARPIGVSCVQPSW
jgi:hypothetical protein